MGTNRLLRLLVEICFPVSSVLVRTGPSQGSEAETRGSMGIAECGTASHPDHGIPWSPLVPLGSYQDPRDGRWYRTIRICRHEWFAENLAYVAQGSSSCGNDPSNDGKFGRLYDWEAAKRLCPPSWRLPTDTDWMELEQFTGMGASMAEQTGWRSTNGEGREFKSITGWSDGVCGTDGIGFRVLPSGYRSGDGSFDCLGTYAVFWSSTAERDGSVLARYFRSLDGSIGRYRFSPTWGLSVRCVRSVNP